MARPSEFTQETADIICARIAGGESLRAICRDEGMPSIEGVRGWLHRYEAFAAQYAQAREDQAEHYAEAILEAVEGVQEAGKDDNARVQAAKLKVDSLKWIASKLKPKVFGDRIQSDVHVTGWSDVLRDAASMLQEAKGKP